jgi:hypothetical protein
VRFSSVKRNGPGCISIVVVGCCSLLNTIDSDCRSRVGSPFTSMNCAVCVTGSTTITNSAGSVNDSNAFSPGGSSISSSVISSTIRSKASSGRSMPELQNIWRQYSEGGSRFGSCAAIERTRELTVNVTSTISSSVGSYPAAQSPQPYSD